MDKTEGLISIDWFIMNIFGKLVSVKYWFTKHSYYTAIKKNKDIPRPAPNSQCYICGLGPSLKDVELNKIQGDIIVVNRFAKYGKLYTHIIPKYYVIIDSLFSTQENIDDFKETLDLYLPKGTIFILNVKLKDLQLMKDYNQNNIYYVTTFNGYFDGNHEYKLNKALPSVGNVVSSSILYSILLGYRRIVLLGCDFNSYASSTQNHCYSDKTQKRLYKRSYELFVYAIYHRIHDLLFTYANNHGVIIENSTKNSLIDSYPFNIDENIYK